MHPFFFSATFLSALWYSHLRLRHTFFSRKHHLFTSSWFFWQLIETLVPQSPYSRVYRFYQSSPRVQFRTLVRSRESVPKELKSKGILASFGPVNPGGENRRPKNIWKSRYLTILRGRRPTREKRELESADRNHIVTIFSIGRDRSWS